METISVINLMPSGKESLAMFIQKTIDAVKSGNENPLHLAIKLKYIELSLSGIKDGIKDDLLTEFAKHGAKSIEILGFKVEHGEVGTKYDFADCDDDELKLLEAQTEEISDRVKKRKEFLKAIQGHLQQVDDDGVVTIIKPPIKSSTTSLKFTLKR